MTSNKDSASGKLIATPKILLAKPPGRGDGSFPAVQIMRDDGIARQKFPPGTLKISPGSLKLLNEQWDFCGDRLGQVRKRRRAFLSVTVCRPREGCLFIPTQGHESLMSIYYSVTFTFLVWSCIVTLH